MIKIIINLLFFLSEVLFFDLSCYKILKLIIINFISCNKIFGLNAYEEENPMNKFKFFCRVKVKKNKK